jgi:hypothetical protein
VADNSNRDYLKLTLPMPHCKDDEPYPVSSALMRFEENQTAPYAIDAIRKIVKAGFALPESLIPWMDAACDALATQKGIKTKVSQSATMHKWSPACWVLWEKHVNGEKQWFAQMKAADEFDCNMDTLLTEYRKLWFKAERIARESRLRKMHGEALDSHDDELVAFLESHFKRLFKKR